MWQRQSAASLFKGREKDLYRILLYTHRPGLGKRVTAWDGITLSTELPPEKNNISVKNERHLHPRKAPAATPPGRENFLG